MVLKKPDYKSIYSIRGITEVETLELGTPKVVDAIVMGKRKHIFQGTREM